MAQLCALCALNGRALLELRFFAVEKVLTANTTTVTHAAENATGIVQADGRVQLGNVALVPAQSVSKCFPLVWRTVFLT